MIDYKPMTDQEISLSVEFCRDSRCDIQPRAREIALRALAEVRRFHDMHRPIVYLACPYSDLDPSVMKSRFKAVTRVAARMMSEGIHVFSPISHGHPIAMVGGLPTDWNFWEIHNRTMLFCCHRLVVLRLDGWKESVGVQAEIEIMKEWGCPVEYVDEMG